MNSKSNNLEKQLDAVRARLSIVRSDLTTRQWGQYVAATWAVFSSQTHGHFAALAKNLARRWAPPSFFTHDDLVQELLLGAWRVIRKFDPTRGKTLKEYVVYNAMASAKRELHRARGALLSGTADKNPSRIQLPISSLSKTSEDGSAFAEFLLAVAPSAEENLMRDENRREAVLRFVDLCPTDVEVNFVEEIAECGDVEVVARRWADELLVTEDHAVRVVVSMISAVARRAEPETVVEEEDLVYNEWLAVMADVATMAEVA